MKKRILAMLLTAALCGGLCPGALAAETPTLTLSVPETLPGAGETFTVTVSITDNPGVCAVQLTLASDSAAVECVSAEIGGVLTGALATTNPSASGGAIVAAANTRSMTADGTLGIFTYRVVSGADAGLRITDILLSDENGVPSAYTVETDILADETEPDAGEAGNGLGGLAPVTPDAPEYTPVTPGQSGQTSSPDKTEDPVPPQETPDLSFTDVPAGFWAESYIRQAVSAGVFQGYADGSFRPNQSITRIQFVTVLWRCAGRPAAGQAAPFVDMDAAGDSDYARAASWGYEQGYIGGYQNADGTVSFQPDKTITRQQAMAILFRYDGSGSGMEQLLTDVYDRQFTDSGQIADYAKDAMYWAVYHGYLSGTSATTLGPNGPATRAQLAKILVGYLEKTGA